MRFTGQTSRKTFTLDPKPLGAGGQATVYAVADDPSLAAKIYHQINPDLLARLRVMLAHPPTDPMAAKGHASIAWPVELLAPEDQPRQPAGFLMPRVHRVQPIIDFFNPKTRREKCPGFNYHYLLRSARNLATVFQALHAKGYLIGDVNESNILVTETALVTIVDVDSFQVIDKATGHVHRCPVGRTDITPPELLAELRRGKVFIDLTRKTEHDTFGLAVLIFQLLMEGTHPFAGVYTGEEDPPATADRILAGHFPYFPKPGLPYKPVALAPPFTNLHQDLRDFFLQCFVDGHEKPNRRPTALQWQKRLDELAAKLMVCRKNPQHFYWQQGPECPWCERTHRLGGRDPFPYQEGVSVPLVTSDGQLASILLPSPARDRVAPLAPGQKSKVRLSSHYSAGGLRRRSPWWLRLARRCGLASLEAWWNTFVQSPEGHHFGQCWRWYLLGAGLFAALVSLLLGRYGCAGPGFLSVAGLAWHRWEGRAPWRLRWLSLLLALSGAFLFAWTYPWSSLSAVGPALRLLLAD
jgi:hypothetical protein